LIVACYIKSLCVLENDVTQLSRGTLCSIYIPFIPVEVKLKRFYKGF